jgi:hypothetical protein
MNKKLSIAFIKHYSACFLAVKVFINRLQNFWKLCIFWNLLHKPWHNNIFFKNLIWIFFWRFFKMYSKKYLPKACKCGSCYLVCTLNYLLGGTRVDFHETFNVKEPKFEPIFLMHHIVSTLKDKYNKFNAIKPTFVKGFQHS